MNKADIVKLALKQQAGKTSTANQPSYLTKNGSIFNAPNFVQNMKAKMPSNSDGIATLNKQNNQTEGTKKEKLDGKNVSAKEGREMAKNAEKESANAERQTAEVKKQGVEVKNYQKDAKKTSQDIKKDEAKFNKEIAKESANITKNQQAMSKESQEMSKTRSEIESLQAELQSLSADRTGIGDRSAFSLKLAGEQDDNKSNSANDDTSSRMSELQSQIESKSGKMTTSGAKLAKLQTSTNKSITVMHSKVRMKSIYYQKAQKTMQAEQKTTDKIMKGAQKFDDVMQTLQTTGKTLQYVGKGMIIAGKALAGTVFGSAAGAALITAGGFTQKAGTGLEMVGQYGSCAANVVKTACNVADGNFAAALQTAGSAIQSGAAAEKSTKGFNENMKAIDAQVDAAKQDVELTKQAKEMAKQLKENGTLDEKGLSVKDARKQLKSQMNEQIKNGNMEIKNGQIIDKRTPKMGADGKFEQNSNLFALESGPRLDPNSPTGLADGIQTATTGTLKDQKTSFGKRFNNGMKKVGNALKKGINTAGAQIKDTFNDPDKMMALGKKVSAYGNKMAGGNAAGAGQKQMAGRTGSNGYVYPNPNYGKLAKMQKSRFV